MLFVGQQDAASGRWTFGLNPALSWGDVGADTHQRLRHLPAEAQQAFCRKYPTRPPADWRCKSQKYQPPGSCQAHLVLLEDLVLTLHAAHQRDERGSGGSGSSSTAVGDPAPQLASCCTSMQQKRLQPAL